MSQQLSSIDIPDGYVLEKIHRYSTPIFGEQGDSTTRLSPKLNLSLAKAVTLR